MSRPAPLPPASPSSLPPRSAGGPAGAPPAPTAGAPSPDAPTGLSSGPASPAAPAAAVAASPGPSSQDPAGVVAPAAPAATHPQTRAPLLRLALGLTLSLLTIIGFCLYAAHEIGRLRDEQMALSERNRRDSLQLIRIQNNLSALAITLRDMTERAEPYPMAAWASTFHRLQLDLAQAFDLERTLAPARPPAQQQQIADTTQRFWEAVERALALAGRGDEPAAVEVIRSSALPRHAELVGLVSQLLVRNTQVEEAAALAARGVYTRVIREIYWLMAILAAAVAIAGVLNIAATRRAFDAVRALSAQLRALTWRMLELQEDVQTSTARELHDEFGQIVTAMIMLLGRVKRNAAPDETLVRDIEEVHTIARDTLERIRTQSRLLHPVILDDFGVDQALAWYVDQFSRQHGIAATFTADTGRDRVPAPGRTAASDSAALDLPPPASAVPASPAPGSPAPGSPVIGSPAIGPSSIGSRSDILVPPDVAIHVYRIVQEALSNVSRHSGAAHAWVRLTQRQGLLTLDIEDDGRGLPHWRSGEARARGTAPSRGGPGRGAPGRGFPGRGSSDASGGPGGIGITSMRERAELVGGELAMTRGPAGGLLIRCTIPLRDSTPGPAGEVPAAPVTPRSRT